MSKNFLRIFLSIILCFCFLEANAETQSSMAQKKDGIFSDFIKKTKEKSILYKNKLEVKYYEERLKKTPNDIDLLESYGKYLKEHNYHNRAIKIYNKLFTLTKDKKYQIEINALNSTKDYEKKNNIFLGYIKQAQDYESRGKIKDANKYYLKAWNLFPNRYEAKFGLAKTYSWLGKNKLADKYYQELIKMAPDNRDLLDAYNKFLQATKTTAVPKKQPQLTREKQPPQTYKPKPQQAYKTAPPESKMFDSYIKQAQAYESQGKASEANEYYLKAQKIAPTRYEAKFGLAKTYGWLHKDKLALQYYNELLKQTPNNVDLLEAYANYLKDTKEYSKSMEILEKLLSQTKNEKYKVNIAEIFFLKKDYQTSLKLYYDIYNQDPSNPEIQKAIALVYFVSGDFDKSIEFYQKYFAQKQDPESILNYAKSLFYTKQMQPAKEILEKYVCAYPNDVGGLSTLADIYMALNETSEAINLINRGLSIEPENIKLQTQVARIDISNKDYCRAQCILLRLLAIDPDNVEIVENLGDISFYTQDFDNALSYYQSIPDSPSSPRLIYKIAQAYHYGKDHPAAQCLYYQLLDDPEFSNKSKIGLAEIDITDNEPLKARKILNNVLRNDPENVQAKKNLAISFYSTGDNLKSIKILKTLPQDDSDITYNLAKAYNKIERKDLALELLRENTQDNAKALEKEILTTIRPAVEPFFNYYYMNPPDGNLNAGKYQRAGLNAYYYLRPNMRVVGTGAFTQYQNLNNIVSTNATLGSIGLEGKPTNHIGYKSAIAFDAFSNNGNLILGNVIVNVNPNDVVSLTSGYIRSLDEIDSYMSAAGVVPSVGPFANQLVGRIVDNKYVIANIGLKLPRKFYAYWGLNVGNKGGANSPNNFYKEIPAGLGKVIYSGPENRHINQALFGYDFYYTAYTNDRSGFGGANLNFSPIGSDGGAIDPASGFPGVGGYFSPTFFIANKFPLTIKGSFRETKLKYVASAFIGTQSIQGQIGLLGPSGGGPNNIRTTPYFGYSIGLRYNENGKYGWAIEYIFNNYMTVAQHLLRASLLIRF